MPSDNPNDYSIKEILTMFVWPELQALRQESDRRDEENRDRFAKLEEWRNRGAGALLLLVAFVIPLSVPVIAGVLH